MNTTVHLPIPSIVARTRALLTGLTLIAAVALVAIPPSAQGSFSPYSVVRTDTQETVTGRLVRLDAGGPATVVVTQKEKSFLPATAELRVGQVVEIVNDDTTIHNAYCTTGDFKYNSGPQQPGSKSTLTFTTAGTYEVRCAIHPKMRLTVTVLP